MAKMFYTLDEAAQTLGMSEDAVKKLAESGKIQQFRDRDKLMFKKEQVDEMLSMNQTMKIDRDDDLALGESIDKKSSKTDSIDLIAETEKSLPKESTKSATATGISVFDADEIDAADPMARTQVTQRYAHEDELTLDSVGSGSGLLDLTRESDDTSLGAVELLDDLTPAGGGSGLGIMAGSSTGVFEVAGGAESAPSGLASLGSSGGHHGHVTYAYVEEEVDTVGDAFGGALMFVSFIFLIIVSIVAISGMRGMVIDLTRALAVDKNNENMILMYVGGMILGGLIAGAIGYYVGKSRARKLA